MGEALVALGRRASEGSFVIFGDIRSRVNTLIGVDDVEERSDDGDEEEQHLRVSERASYSRS